MSKQFASRLQTIKPSITLAINAKAAELRSAGKDVVAFGVGEPDFEPPAHVFEAAHSAMLRGASKYTAVTGTAELKEAISSDCLRRRKIRPSHQEICVSVGAKHALFNLAVALFEEGDEVILPSPCWVSYPEQIRLLGATPVLVPTDAEGHFKLQPQALKQALSPRTKAIVLCSPSNPTGSAYSKSEWLALLEILRPHDTWIILDEIYSELVYDNFDQISALELAPDLRDRIVVVDGVSKTYAMTGWRIGWSIAPPSLTKMLDMVQGQSTTNATAVAQAAAAAALKGPREDVEKMRSTFEQRRNLMVSEINKVPYLSTTIPNGAFYLFVDCTKLLQHPKVKTTLTSDDDLALFFLNQAHVACVPGGSFGTPGFLRLSYATSESRIREGCGRLAETVKAMTTSS